MSGSSIGSVLGGAIGFMIGGPAGIQYGISIGGVAGGLLMPDKIGLEDQHGPRLTDLKTTTSTYGSSINRLFGTSRIAGEIIWAKDIKETRLVREEEVGKGGSESYEVITYTYSIDMAVAFCEGPVDGVRKIWADSVLIYDKTVGGTTAAYKATEQVSGSLTVYDGTDTQEVDWFLQANNSDSPAYRNTCYIVFNSFQLEQFGNRIPNITAEIVKSGEYIQEEHELGGYNYSDEMSDVSGYSLSTIPDGPTLNNSDYFYLAERENDGSGATGSYMVAKYGTNGLIDYKKYDNGVSGNVQESLISGDGIVISEGYIGAFFKYYLFNENLEKEKTWQLYPSNDPDWGFPRFAAYSDGILIIAADDTSVGSTSSNYRYLLSSENLGNCSSSSGAQDPRLDAFIQGPELTELDSSNIMCAGDGKICIFSDNSGLSSSVLGAVVRVWDLHTGVFLGTVDCNAYYTGRHFFQAPSSTKFIDDNILYSYRSDFNARTGDLLSIDLINMVVIDSITVPFPNNWINNGTFGVHSHGVIRSVVIGTGYQDFRINPSLNSDTVTVSSICQELMLKSNINLNEMDLTDTESVLVDGFVADNVSAARSSISILQSVYFFDLVEYDFQIHSKRRGSLPEKLLTDLGVDEENELQHKKELVTELPKKVTFRYANKDIDYMTSSQSTLRIGGSSDNNITLDLPIVLTDTSAKQLTELYLFNAWTAKNTFQFSITLHDNLNLDVGDVVSLNYNNEIFSVRLLKISSITNLILNCESVLESEYTSTAIGQDTSEGYIPPNLALSTASNILIFNAPTLANSLINSFGVYYVASGEDEFWKGCVVFKSKDSGQTFDDIGVVLENNAFGTVYSVLGGGSYLTVDLINTITVKLISGSLESITLEQLYNGQNYIKIGDEILQYQTATALGNNQYTLSTLLRGRRGTEHAVNSHLESERFIFLDPQLVNFDFSTLNTERQYRAVSFGRYLDDASSISHTYDGTNLVPFSPINQTSSYYEPNDDLNIKWMRRDRYISGYFRTLPMSEETESYNLYIYDDDQTLIRTELVTDSSEFLYDTTLRTNDGLIGDENDEFYFQFSQNSTAIGEGYKSKLIRKYNEHVVAEYLVDFNEPDGTPSYIGYTEFANASSYTISIASNRLHLYTPGMSRFQRVGVSFNNNVFGDFDIQIDFDVASERFGQALLLSVGSVYIAAWRSSTRQFAYRDFDDGATRYVSRTYTYGSLRMQATNGIISFMYKDGPAATWTTIGDTVSTYTLVNRLVSSYMYYHESIGGDGNMDIDNFQGVY